MELKALPTNNPNHNPFSVLTDAQFEFIIDQGFTMVEINPRPNLVTGKIFYLNHYMTEDGSIFVVASDTGVFAWHVKDYGYDEPTEVSNLYSAGTVAQAWNATYSFVMSKK